MTIMEPIVSQSAAEIARVAFSMFVYVADIEKNVTPQEVRRFQALLDETAWVENEDLRRGLIELQERYSSFWANYEEGVFAANPASIAEGLNRVCGQLGEERSKLIRRELYRFLEQLDRGPYVAKLVQSDQRARAQAREELLTILNAQDQQPVAAGRKPDLANSTAMSTAPNLPIWPAARYSPGEAKVWTAGKTRVRCVSVVTETHDTKTYVFVAEPRTLFHFKPGQFITIEVPVGSNVLRRSYTISSSPSRPYTLSITVKKVPMGWMSNWLFDNMVEGFECTINGPAGKFTCLDHPAEKLLFLAAGSGITPSMSMLRWLVDTSSRADVVFINNVRTPDDVIFHQELLHLSTRMGERMRLAIVPAAVSRGGAWNGPVGKFDEALLRILVPDLVERETFVCGPPGYMSAAKALLKSIGFPLGRYHDESFGAAAPVPMAPAVAPPAGSPATSTASTPTAPTPRPLPQASRPAPTTAQTAAASALKPPAGPSSGVGNNGTKQSLAAPPDLKPTPAATRPPPQATRAPAPLPSSGTAPAAGVPKGGKVTIQGSGASFVAQPEQTILEAADASGVALEHSCRAGICGTCRMRKVSGQVKTDGQSLLSEADIGTGYVLTCMSQAIGDVILSQ